MLASSSLLCRGKSLFFFFSSSSQRAAAAGGDEEETQWWHCWVKGGQRWSLFFSFFLLYMLFFIFFLSFGLQLLPSSVFPFGLFLPSRAPSLVSAPHLCLFSASVFIGKEGRWKWVETWLGRPLCCRPTIAWGGTSPLFLQHVRGHGSAEQMNVLGQRLFELKEGRKGSENRGAKAPFPCFLHVQGKKTVYETAPFWAKRVV